MTHRRAFSEGRPAQLISFGRSSPRLKVPVVARASALGVAA